MDVTIRPPIMSEEELKVFSWDPAERERLGVKLEIVDPDNPNGPHLVFENEAELRAMLEQWPDPKVGRAHELTWGFLNAVAADIVFPGGYFGGIEYEPTQWAIKEMERYADEIVERTGFRIKSRYYR